MSNIISNKFTRVIPAPLYHIGDIAFIAYNTIPDGWMECNGSAISRTTFVELFNKIGTTYGAGDESTTFNLPDLRGEFIRGWDHGRGVDSGRALGSEQLDAFQGHLHSQNGSLNWNSIGALDAGNVNGTNVALSNTGSPVADGTHDTPRTASETRPRNVALVPIIKVKNIAGSDAEVIGANADTVDGLHASDFALMLAGNNTSPIGTVILTAANAPDPGWLECDGSAISRIIYPDLFNKIGTTYGIGDGSSTFNLPDLRGEFVRGWDHGRSIDPGRTLGSEQLDAFQGHRHAPLTPATTYYGVNGGNGKAAGTGSNDGFTSTTGDPITDGINGTPRKANETRPRNVALMYVIKAKNIASVDPTVSDGNAKTLAGYYPKDFMLATDAIGYSFNNYLKEVGPGDYGAHFNFRGSDLIVSPFEASINKLRNFMGTPYTMTLPPRKASYVYAQDAGESTTVPIIGHYDAVYPEPDQYTVGQWIFNTPDAIGNSAVGNGLAVANNLAPSGTVTQVDGWADYCMQGNGTSGYYTSANSTGFPTAAQERELDIIFTPYNISSQNMLFEYGAASTGARFGVYIIGGGNLYVDTYNTVYDTGFVVEIGKAYYVSVIYSGTTLVVYVNGVKIYNTTVTLTTAAGEACALAAAVSHNYFSNAIIHYAEIRNKCRTPQQIAAISNKLCLPCRYTGYSASFPANDTTTGAHIYKFDDASGTTVTDENGTLNGTVTGTTIVDSEIGLGKARKFNGASDKVLCGNYQFSSTFTIITAFKLNAINASTDMHIVSNYNQSVGQGLIIRAGTTNLALAKVAGYSYPSNSAIVLGKTVFCAVSVVNNIATFYNDSITPDQVPFAPDTSANVALAIGCMSNSINFFNGNIEYLAIIPRSLSQAEIAQYYNTLMAQKERTLIDDCLPLNSISLGFTRTGSSALIEYNDTDYKYMRNEGATKTEGNKRLFLGWKYYSGVTFLKWDNPFGTRKVRTYYTWAQDANGTNEIDVMSRFNGGSSIYGIQSTPESVTSMIPSYRIIAETKQGGVVLFNSVWQTSGYIGCYAEVL